MKHTIRFTIPHEYDISGIELWLEKMAAKGLYLKKYRPFYCTFTKGPPEKVRYRLEPHPRFFLELDITESKEHFYGDLGWRYVCEIIQTMLIFTCTDPLAAELHTDPTLQVPQMRRLVQRQRRNILLYCTMLLVVIALYAWDRHSFTQATFYSTIQLYILLFFIGISIPLELTIHKKLKETLFQMEQSWLHRPHPFSDKFEFFCGLTRAMLFLFLISVLLLRLLLGAPT